MIGKNSHIVAPAGRPVLGAQAGLRRRGQLLCHPL